MLPLILIVVVFITVVRAVFPSGAAAVTPSSMLGARLRALGGQQQPVENKPAFRACVEQGLDPLSRVIPLSPADASRTGVLPSTLYPEAHDQTPAASYSDRPAGCPGPDRHLR